MPSSKKPQFKAARMRALIKQNLDSMRSWSNSSVDALIKQLDGLADVEVAFATGELQRAVPAGMKTSVRTVEVTESFARSVVSADPLDVGTNLLQQNIEEAVKGPGALMKLTARQGAIIRMPDGTSVKKAFRGLAERQGELFSRAVLDGLLTGESTAAIARSLYGELGFSTEALTPRQVALAQTGNAWKMAKHQVRTLVRTSVNATANAASQQVYRANPEVTKKYRWVATLDSRTSPICRNLDQSVYEYGKGPTPANPPHFNCRSTTIPIIDYEGLGLSTPPNTQGYRPTPESKPSSKDPDGGRVPVNVSAAQHIYDLRANTKSGRKSKFEPSAAQARMLNGGRDTAAGRQKARYFNRLADRYGPDGAMKRFMRTDGTEVSLTQLQQRYGKPDKITQGKKAAAPKPKPKPKPKAAQARPKPQAQKPFKDQFVDSPEVAEYMESVGGTGAVADKVLTALSDDPLRKRNIDNFRKFVRKNNVAQNFTFADEDITKNLASYEGAKIQAIAASQKAKVELLRKQGYTEKDLAQSVDFLKRLEAGDTAVLPRLIAPLPTALGYTRQCQGVVNISMRRNSALGKKKDLLQAVEKSLDRTMEYVKTGKGELPWATYSDVDKRQEWIPVMLHETGHQVHYAGINGGSFKGSGFQVPGQIASVSQYGLSNEKERFAEAFVQYVLNPAGLKEKASGLYDWVDDAVQKAIQ
jgi:SPP1 gp7 family putative phage head morphogenesis protein